MGIRRGSRADAASTFLPPYPGLHLFYTLSTNGTPNSKLGGVVCGDVFILRISDSPKDGKNYYVDIDGGNLHFLKDLWESSLSRDANILKIQNGVGISETTGSRQ